MRARTLWISAGTALGIAGFAILFATRERLPRAHITPARELRLVNVSLGTNHFFSTEPRWKQVARRLTPKKWSAWFGPIRSGSYTTPFDSLVLYLQETDLATGQ